MSLHLEFKIVTYNNINILNCIMLAGGRRWGKKDKKDKKSDLFDADPKMLFHWSKT